MHCANVGGPLHHLLTMQLCAELQAESSDHIPDSDMAYLILSQLICGPCKGPQHVLQMFDLMSQYRDHRSLAACSWGSFGADSWCYFRIVVSPYERY